MNKPEPQAAIAGFHQDDDGVWVAELECGHPQHVRHRPPFQVTQWVTSQQGRDAHIGARLACKFCRMPRLPGGMVEYKRTPLFDAATLPAALTRSHSVKQGTWGEIVVTSGRVLYVLEDDELALMLRPGIVGCIAPERPHHVELQGQASLYVRFLRPSSASPGAVGETKRLQGR